MTSALWLVLAGHGGVASQFDELEGRLARTPQKAVGLGLAIDDTASRIAAAPIFALTTGPGAVAEPAVRLQGVAITPGRKAALVSINGEPAQWLTVGANQDGVTLMDVQSSKITLDGPTGFRDVGLWDAPTPAPANGAPSPNPQGAHLTPPSPTAGR